MLCRSIHWTFSFFSISKLTCFVFPNGELKPRTPGPFLGTNVAKLGIQTSQKAQCDRKSGPEGAHSGFGRRPTGPVLAAHPVSCDWQVMISYEFIFGYLLCEQESKIARNKEIMIQRDNGEGRFEWCCFHRLLLRRGAAFLRFFGRCCHDLRGSQGRELGFFLIIFPMQIFCRSSEQWKSSSLLLSTPPPLLSPSSSSPTSLLACLLLSLAWRVRGSVRVLQHLQGQGCLEHCFLACLLLFGHGRLRGRCGRIGIFRSKGAWGIAFLIACCLACSVACLLACLLTKNMLKTTIGYFGRLISRACGPTTTAKEKSERCLHINLFVLWVFSIGNFCRR